MKKEFLPLIFYIIFSCGTKNESINNILPGNDPNFKIISHNDIGFESTNRKVDVFGLYIYAYPEVNDLKLLHTANIMAQYLDNDEDGNVDRGDLDKDDNGTSDIIAYDYNQDGEWDKYEEVS